MSSKKKEFNEALTELVELANVSANKLNKEQIHMYFKDILEDESKYAFIYEYLRSQKIEIEDLNEERNQETVNEEKNIDEKIKKRVETEEAKKIYSMYIDEVKNVEKRIIDYEKLLEQVIAKDEAAIKMVTEIYLDDVIEIAGKYEDSPMTHSDIVAEGNLALFEGIVKYKGKTNQMEFEEYIFDYIRRQIEKAIFEELGMDRTSNHLVERINALNDATTELAKKLGREASLEELSKELDLPEDEIKSLMKISIDALTIDE